MKLWHVSDSPQIHGNDLALILQEKLVQNSCQQIQTLLDSNLRALSIFVLFVKITRFWPIVLGRTFPVTNFLYSVISRQYSHDAREADILNRSGLPLNGD